MKTAIPILALVVSTAVHGLLQADHETSQDGSAKYRTPAADENKLLPAKIRQIRGGQ